MALKGRQSLLNGAIVLAVSTVVVHLIGMLYKIPLTALIGEVGRGYFNAAYDIYTPLYAVSMAGLPVAVSKLVSQNVALNRYRDARMIFKVAFRLFVITGVLGTGLLLLLSYPYSLLIDNPKSLLCILVIAPSILFCCLMSAYRGYYEGMSNMVPTAVSQVIEALGKLILGLLFAFLIMKFGMAEFHAGRAVFGVEAATEAEALSAIYSYSAAGAIGGVTIGTLIGYLFLFIRHRAVGDRITRAQLVNAPRPSGSISIAKTLIAVAIPIVLSSLILNITNLIDAVTIQNRLAYAIEKAPDVIRGMYAQSLAVSQTLDSDIAKYLYGVYGTVLDFKNLVPTITMTLGVSAIPAMSAAWATRNRQKIKISVESVLRVTMLISLPSGFGMAVLSTQILTLVYGGSRPSLVPIGSGMLFIYGIFVFLMSVSTPITNMLQAIGRSDVPVKAMIAGAIVKLISNFVLIGNPQINVKGAPIGSILCYLVIVGYELFVLLRQTRLKPNVVSVFIKPFVCAVLCAAAAWAVNGLLYRALSESVGMMTANAIATVAAIVAAIVVYAVSLLLLRGLSKDDILMLPKGEKIAKALEKYRLIG